MNNRADRPALEVLAEDARIGILRALASRPRVPIPDALSALVEDVIIKMVVAGEAALADDGSELYPTAIGKFAYAEAARCAR